MGYVAVKGGTAAIEASIERLEYERLKGGTTLEVQAIQNGMRGLIDQVMSESSLYSKELAALAIKQAEGSMEEAVFLLRSYRSTLPRKHYTQIADTEKMHSLRRISASFKDIVGGQILGAAYDYTHRLLNFDLLDEKAKDVEKWLQAFHQKHENKEKQQGIGHLPKVTTQLRKEGIIPMCIDSDEEPIDITKGNLEFPTTRSVRLQMLTRGQTGAMTSLGYAALRAYGDSHPTVGELRIGELALYVGDPLENGVPEEEYYIGQIEVTEVESLIPRTQESESGQKEMVLDMGYGICYGQNETKAIAMSILDHCLELGDKRNPVQDEEFVLLDIDSVESSGFISHLKLPHYVTFQSKLDTVRKTQKTEEKEGEKHHADQL
ncbi:MAG: carbon-phosphorus lyase complex subunit PhnI [Cellulosilyticaceae bacterium]